MFHLFFLGANSVGECGYGTTTSIFLTQNLPYVAMPATVTITSITAVWGSTCAITGSGSIICWGYNISGQLGRGDIITQIWSFTAGKAISFSDSEPAIQVTGGYQFFCSIFQSGRARCWGKNKDIGATGCLGQEHSRSSVGNAGSDMSSISYISFAPGAGKVSLLN